MFSPNTQDQGTIVLAQQDYLPIVVESFLVERRAKRLSPGTISFYRKKLKYFQDYCEAQALTQIGQITPDSFPTQTPTFRRILMSSDTTCRKGLVAHLPRRVLSCGYKQTLLLGPPLGGTMVSA